MGANKFVTTIKADGSAKDICDLDDMYRVYIKIQESLLTNDKATFSLNVLCVLCRNIEKVPSWCDKVDNTALLRLSIECVRNCCDLVVADRVKTLACIYHVHKHVIKQNSQVPPEMILKLSSMPFESDEKLLKEYCKTYWGILVDRFMFIERLKTQHSIAKLLPQLITDITKVIYIYDSVQFCTNILVFVVKKLYYLYNNVPEELNKCYENIFDAISAADDKKFKKLKKETCLDLYVKFSDCLYVVIENMYKNKLKISVLSSVVRICISLLDTCPDICHSLDIFYNRVFCAIFSEKAIFLAKEKLLKNLNICCLSMADKNSTVMDCTYPFLGQLLRVYIENNIPNLKIDSVGSFRTTCLCTIMTLMDKLENTRQLTKCENCNVITGLHDALRLSFLAKHMIVGVENANKRELLSMYCCILKKQYDIISQLIDLDCVNSDKYYRKVQTDTHNAAILLNKVKEHGFSIQLFDIYINNELVNIKDTDYRNISRALYNRSICELESKSYEKGLLNAYWSLLTSLPESLNSDKHMSLVIDIKAKISKDKSEESDYQNISVLEAYKAMIMEKTYCSLISFLWRFKLSLLLKHEFKAYVQLWPSIVPISGVWASLYELLIGLHPKDLGDNREEQLDTLCAVVMETATVVRTIHMSSNKTIVMEILERFKYAVMSTMERRVMYASMLFLKSEYDIADATCKHGWKSAGHTIDPEQDQNLRTIELEHVVLTPALQAVDVWTEIISNMKDITSCDVILHGLRIAEVFVYQLLFTSRKAHALQLALVCCKVAEAIGHRELYIRNAGVMIYHASRRNEFVDELVKGVTKCIGEVLKDDTMRGEALGVACEIALYEARCGARGLAARMTQLVQARVSRAPPGSTSMEMAIGRLLEAQNLLCSPVDGVPSDLTAVNALHRHYLAVVNNESRWTNRRRVSLNLKWRISVSGAAAVRLSRDLRLWRRARAAASVTTPRAAAATQAALFASLTNTHANDAQIKIDNRLKYILGLQTSEASQDQTTGANPGAFTPTKRLETCNFTRTQASPSLPCTMIPAYQMPTFFTHMTCTCHACHMPEAIIMTCQTVTLEASMYYRTKEFAIAKNYFSGALKCLDIAEKKIKDLHISYKDTYKNDMYDDIFSGYERDLKAVELECLIEMSFMELTLKTYEKANEYFVRIHEIVSDGKVSDPYIHSEVSNLMITAACLRQVKKPIPTRLEWEFNKISISNVESITPVVKVIPNHSVPTIVIKDEDIPKRRRVIKLNLDEDNTDEVKTDKVDMKTSKFKVPEPKIVKPSLENVTPRPIKSKPKSLVIPIETEPSTPQLTFHTPCQTPKEEFFTPMSTPKTYSRKNVVKKLEEEFSTPKTEKHVSCVLSSSRDKRSLRRATSPGKLINEKPLTRSRKARQPVTDK